MTTEYTWTFAQSFLVFLCIAFLSMTIAAKLRSLIPMPLIYGVLFILGFAFNLLPTDMLLSANMIAVGTIAYNVLVVHSGTMINLHVLREKKKEALLCIAAMAVLILADVLLLTPLCGRSIALLAPGSVVGGGASCAIASRLVLANHPELSVFPWLIFMLQGLFSVPIVTWALKKESSCLLADYRKADFGKKTADSGAPATSDGNKEAEQKTVAAKKTAGSDTPDRKMAVGTATPDRKRDAEENSKQNPEHKAVGPQQTEHASSAHRSICDRIPAKYKTTPYYLGLIMIVTVLNNLLHQTLLASSGINGNITALLLGFLFGSLGLIDRAPLFKSDSYGLLILGLMGLMANTLANCSWQLIVAYIPALLIVFVISTLVLVVCGILGARLLGFRPYRGIALTMNCVMGFPVNNMLLDNAAAAGETEAEQGYLKGQLGPVLGIGTMLISSALSTIVVGIMAALV